MKKHNKQVKTPQSINRGSLMVGTVKSKNMSERGSKFGTIVGKNGIEYHFNTKALPLDYTWDAINIGDTVQFFGEYTTDNRYQAKNIRLVRSTQPSANSGATNDREENEYVSVCSETKDDISLSFYKPGFSQYFNKDKLVAQLHNNDELEVIEKLSRVLYVSSSYTHPFSNKDYYPFFLIGATSCTKAFIRGKYEYLLIFSYFDSGDWQMNSLKVAKEIRKGSDIRDRRPLANFYILVSNARDLLHEVRQTKGGTEAAVIPFSFTEIKECQDDHELIQLINERFDEFYFANNLLGESGTIEEEVLLFGDRGKTADAIVQRCVEHKHSGIFGLRRSGKSSVLRATERRLDAHRIKHITIESRSKLETISSWRLALYDIARLVRIACSGIEQGADESNAEYNKRLNLNSTEADYEKRPTACFVDDVKKYTRNEETFVIAIDEIEVITYNTAATGSIWKSLEAYRGFWGALRDCGCALIICGVNSTINEKSTIEYKGQKCDNPMYARIQYGNDDSESYLPAFTDEQTKVMINTLGGFSNIAFDNVYVLINRAFGGQPYAIRQFCAYAYEKVKQNCKTGSIYQLQKATYDALLDSFNKSSQGEELVKTILEYIEIYEDEYRMLKKIALSLDKYRSINRNDIPLIDHLIKYGIIELNRDTGFISFNIESIRDYLRRYETKELEDMDNTERRQYIQNCVCEYEKKLKKYILNCFIYGSTKEEDARKMLKYCRGSKDDDSDILLDVETCEIAEFFDHKKFQIYFSSLRKLIYNNWESFKKGFENVGIGRQQFNVYMIDLNAGRTDADHYDAENLTDYPDDWEIDKSVIEKFKYAYHALKPFFDKQVF